MKTIEFGKKRGKTISKWKKIKINANTAVANEEELDEIVVISASPCWWSRHLNSTIDFNKQITKRKIYRSINQSIEGEINHTEEKRENESRSSNVDGSEKVGRRGEGEKRERVSGRGVGRYRERKWNGREKRREKRDFVDNILLLHWQFSYLPLTNLSNNNNP